MYNVCCQFTELLHMPIAYSKATCMPTNWIGYAKTIQVLNTNEVDMSLMQSAAIHIIHVHQLSKSIKQYKIYCTVLHMHMYGT